MFCDFSFAVGSAFYSDRLLAIAHGATHELFVPNDLGLDCKKMFFRVLIHLNYLAAAYMFGLLPQILSYFDSKFHMRLHFIVIGLVVGNNFLCECRKILGNSATAYLFFSIFWSSLRVSKRTIQR